MNYLSSKLDGVEKLAVENGSVYFKMQSWNAGCGNREHKIAHSSVNSSECSFEDLKHIYTSINKFPVLFTIIFAFLMSFRLFFYRFYTSFFPAILFTVTCGSNWDTL